MSPRARAFRPGERRPIAIAATLVGEDLFKGLEVAFVDSAGPITKVRVPRAERITSLRKTADGYVITLRRSKVPETGLEARSRTARGE